MIKRDIGAEDEEVIAIDQSQDLEASKEGKLVPRYCL